MTNRFSTALKGKQEGTAVPEAAAVQPKGRGKHIGGYFDPAAAKQLRQLALDEDTSVQGLLEEAIDMLFQARSLPMIATRKGTAS